MNMGVSKKSGKTPKSSMLIGFSIINHPYISFKTFPFFFRPFLQQAAGTPRRPVPAESSNGECFRFLHTTVTDEKDGCLLNWLGLKCSYPLSEMESHHSFFKMFLLFLHGYFYCCVPTHFGGVVLHE